MDLNYFSLHLVHSEEETIRSTCQHGKKDDQHIHTKVCTCTYASSDLAFVVTLLRESLEIQLNILMVTIMQVCVQTDVKCVNKPTNDYQLASIIIIQIQIKQKKI